MKTNTVQDIRDRFRTLYQLGLLEKLFPVNEFVTDRSGCKMLEIRSASFVADEPSIFGTVNSDYIERELEWYRSMSLNIHDIPRGAGPGHAAPQAWTAAASPTGEINSNYGWCIWHTDNYKQYHNVVTELTRNPSSRRAVMIYTRPSMWVDFDAGGKSDFMCTNAVQYMIRDGLLETVVQMRSNDVVYGYKNDFAWQKYVRDMLAAQLKVEPGVIYWNVGSLHIYEKHFDLVANYHLAEIARDAAQRQKPFDFDDQEAAFAGMGGAHE